MHEKLLYQLQRLPRAIAIDVLYLMKRLFLKTSDGMAAPSFTAAVKAAITGTVVADAATLGSHWEYDATKLADLAQKNGGYSSLLFVDPIAQWHAQTRKSGDVSMYGELALLTAKSLKAKCALSLPDFYNRYYATFGPCGSYHGYADHATKLSVYSHMRSRMEREKDTFPPRDLPKSDLPLKEAVHPAMPSLAEQHSGQALVDAALQLATTACPDASPAGLEWVKRCATAYSEIYAGFHGADDNQSNGNGKLAVVAAAFAHLPEPEFEAVVSKAVRCTQNNDEAVQWSIPVAHIIAGVVKGKAVAQAIEEALPRFNEACRTAVDKALAAARSGPTPAPADIEKVVWDLGPSCAMSNTVPGALYILSINGGQGGERGYADALADNIVAGGETNGRALLIGAILAARAAHVSCASASAGEGVEHGVPTEWLRARLGEKARAALLDVLA